MKFEAKSYPLEYIPYDSSYRQQVIDLTVHEYPFMESFMEKRFIGLYEDPFQNKDAKGFLALENGNVVAFISYSKWPMMLNKTQLDSYQMVGLVVSPEMRGKGIFKNLLKSLDQKATELNPQIMFGFPVEISKAGFLKQGWKNICDLEWYASPVSPFSILSPKPFSETGKITKGLPDFFYQTEHLESEASKTYWDYREGYVSNWPTYSYTFEKNGCTTSMMMKWQQRKGRFGEMIIGKIFSDATSENHIIEAFKSLKKELKKSKAVAFVSFCLNPHCSNTINNAMKKAMFHTSKKICLIVKSYNTKTDLLNPALWNIHRADMETW